MTERRLGAQTLHGRPLTLIGPELRLGDLAPGFQMLGKDLQPVRFEQTQGKPRIFSVVPSLDTGVCDLQSRRFNAEAAKFRDALSVYTISMDTPFAQARWCGAADAQNLVLLSDILDQSFGPAYGVRIEELGLLARAVFVLDGSGRLRHVQYVGEMGEHPDYDAALSAARELL